MILPVRDSGQFDQSWLGPLTLCRVGIYRILKIDWDKWIKNILWSDSPTGSRQSIGPNNRLSSNFVWYSSSCLMSSREAAFSFWSNSFSITSYVGWVSSFTYSSDSVTRIFNTSSLTYNTSTSSLQNSCTVVPTNQVFLTLMSSSSQF